MARCFSARADRVRECLRDNVKVAPWYRFNILDYVQADHPKRPDVTEVVARLIASDFAATSALYQQGDYLAAAQARLKDALIRT